MKIFLTGTLIFFSLLNAIAQKRYDVVIYGGTPAGVAAAIQSSRMGLKVALLEPGDHLGGMLVEGLGGSDIDNHLPFQNSPAVGGIALEFYRRIAKAYQREVAFEQMIRNGDKDPDLWRFESSVAEKIIKDWVAEEHIDILYRHLLAEDKDAVVMQGNKIQAIRTTDGKVIEAGMFIDATVEGDLLAAAGISYTIGREANNLYNETRNGICAETTHAQFEVKVDPYIVEADASSGLIPTIQDEPLGAPESGDHRIQAYCYRMCLTQDDRNKIPFTKPTTYDRKNYTIYLRYLKAGGKLYTPVRGLPNGKTDMGAWHDLSHNLYGMNHGYPDGSYSQRKEILQYHRDFTQGLFYFFANDPEIKTLDPDFQQKWASWGLTKDEFTDNDGWPRMFYVRDARRMVSDYVITEHHVRKDNPEPVPDPIAVAFWPPDVHSVRRIVKDGYAYNEGFVFGGDFWQPLPISYRALVPKVEECQNLLAPSCPSSSHIAYGAIRLEWTFMALGQAAATAAKIALSNQSSVQEVEYDAIKETLLHDGQVLQLQR